MKALKILGLILIPIIIAAVSYLGYLYSLNGTVFHSTGDVSIMKAGTAEWIPLETRYKLKKDDAIKTAVNAECSILFGSTANMIVTLKKNTELKVASKDKQTLDLIDGNLLAAFSRPSPVKKFIVKTPVGTCGVRGTGWSLTAHPTATKIKVFEGRVKSGKNLLMYENDPFIIRDGDSLTITKAENTTYKYALLDPTEYPAWNSWLTSSSKRLAKIGVLNLVAESYPIPYPTLQKGITYGSWRANGYQKFESELSIKKMEVDTNAHWINIVTTWYQNTLQSTEIFSHPTNTPTDEGLELIFKKAQRLGMHTMLTPFVDPLDGEGGLWRANIGFSTTEEWDLWFESYTTFILHYAALAERLHINILNIGTELSNSTLKRPDKWIELIAAIREVYTGKLVYTANWFEEYKEITFWEHLDYAGISAYFPVASRDNPFYLEIVHNWKKWANNIEIWQATHKKPVIFPEIGYRSIPGAAKEPWDYAKGGPVALKHQYNCYKAVFKTFWHKKWFYGMYWWVWETKTGIFGEFDTSYSMDDKPSAKLVNKWYAKPDPHKYKTFGKIIKDKFMGWFGKRQV